MYTHTPTHYLYMLIYTCKKRKIKGETQYLKKHKAHKDYGVSRKSSVINVSSYKQIKPKLQNAQLFTFY